MMHNGIRNTQILFSKILTAVFKDIKLLQKRNSMQYPAKYSKRMPLQNRNSMHCAAIYCDATHYVTACSSQQYRPTANAFCCENKHTLHFATIYDFDGL